jgi:Enterobacter phage Enc34, ssDNA-binding protein
MSEAKQATSAVMLNDVRLSFANALFEAQKVQGQGDAKFSASFILPPNHPAVAAVKAMMKKVAEEKWGAKAGEMFMAMKAGDKLCLHDGDSKPQYEGYKGNLFINASNKVKPLVIDGAKSPLTATDGKPYSGCFVNASVELWAQDNQFGKRINASLKGVQFLRDGQRLSGGGVASADDFEAIPEAAGAATTAGPVAGASTGGNPDPFA